MKRSLLALMALLLSISAFGQKGAYVLKLSSVEIEGNSKGLIAIDSIKPAKLMTYTSKYTDSLIEGTFTFDLESIPFEITNKSKKSIKIIWNDAAYIDHKKTSGKIMHVGIKYINRGEDQPASTIIGDSKISDLATPINNVYYSSGSYGGWRTTNLFPTVGKKDEKPLVGEKVKLLLPIISEGKQIDYVFTFVIAFNEYKK
jgi:hypothetical protein